MIGDTTITEQYEQFVKTAKKLAGQDTSESPPFDSVTKRGGIFGFKKRYNKLQSKWEDKYQIHLVGMLEMYSIRYGDPEKTRAILEYIEDKFFSNLPGEVQVAIFPADWRQVKQEILEGKHISQEGQ